MKIIRFTFPILCSLLLVYSLVFGAFSTHTGTSITRIFDSKITTLDDSIIVTVSFTNSEAHAIRGFYYTDHIPQGLIVNKLSVKINDQEVSDYLFESGTVDDVYPGCVPYRWILETPITFAEDNPINPGASVQIVYSLSSNQHGTFYCDEFNWIGYYQDATIEKRIAFGYSEDNDKETLSFLNSPPTAHNDSAITEEDTTITINVTENDIDTDGIIDLATVTIVTNPNNGTTFVNTDGTVTYIPVANFNGIDTFGYMVNDNNGAASNEATVTITVKPVNDTPIVNDQSFMTDEDVVINETLSASDIDGDELIYTIVANGGKGTAVITDSSNGTFTYSPNENIHGSDTFTFKVNDGLVDSLVATVTIDIIPVNDVSEADSQSLSIDEDTSVNITLTGTDVDGDTLSYEIVTQPSHGTLSGTCPDLIYTPNTDYNGVDSFTFKVNDGAVDSNIATVSITVKSVNDLPLAVDDITNTKKDNDVIVNVIENDIDPDGTIDPGSITIIATPSNGSTNINGDGTVTYTPVKGFTGTDSFTYTVKDNDGGISNEANVTITVYKAPGRLDLDRKIYELKDGITSEEEVKEIIQLYMEDTLL